PNEPPWQSVLFAGTSALYETVSQLPAPPAPAAALPRSNGLVEPQAGAKSPPLAVPLPPRPTGPSRSFAERHDATLPAARHRTPPSRSPASSATAADPPANLRAVG